MSRDSDGHATTAPNQWRGVQPFTEPCNCASFGGEGGVGRAGPGVLLPFRGCGCVGGLGLRAPRRRCT